MLSEDPNAKSSWPSLLDKRNSSSMSTGNSFQSQFWLGAGGSQSRAADVKTPLSSQAVQRKDACSGSDSQNTQPGVNVARKRRIHAQVRTIFQLWDMVFFF